MKQHHGNLVAGLAIAAFFGLVATAQAQPAGAPPSAPAPEMAAPMHAAPPVAVGYDSMAGQLGFGLGLTNSGTSLVQPSSTIMMKYWLSDVLALMPQAQLKVYNADGAIWGAPAGSATSWAVSPNALILYSPWKTTSTRLSFGGGLGFTIAKWAVPVGSLGPVLNQNPTAPPPSDTFIGVQLPIYAGVEHFFTKWFSMGIAVQDNLVSYGKLGGQHVLLASIDSMRSDISGTGFLFFYTD